MRLRLAGKRGEMTTNEALRRQQREASIRAAKRRYPQIRYGCRVGQDRRS